jgi:hypothetical protein
MPQARGIARACHLVIIIVTKKKANPPGKTPDIKRVLL